ncbi:hypothetical protein GGI15_003431 [Coemansia interrupta]|uniref:Eukaryotic translation initiation factor 4E n=1 Tax=Coemansia interrupta TaxID=1126814 RepID=A0A9W8H9A3_9FUNG|nr:hypothetical protein GGI15_003431 [Coemansia interrupta]
MYAAPNRIPTATKITRDVNSSSAAKQPAKIVQYSKRDKPRSSFSANDDELTAAPAEPAVADGSTADSATGSASTTPYLASGGDATAAVQRGAGVWGTSRLVGEETQNGQQYQPQPVDAAAEHPLTYAWTFWFMHRMPGHKIDDYEAAMIKIASFASVESFWAVYSHLKRPDEVPTITDYHMFRQGVRPVWEDPANVSGGKWMIRLKKGLSSRLWEKLAMAVVGDVFGLGDEICGIVLSIRNSEDILSLWNKNALDLRTNAHIRDMMKLSMNLPIECIMEYKAHNDSLKDNFNFRNADVYK